MLDNAKQCESQLIKLSDLAKEAHVNHKQAIVGEGTVDHEDYSAFTTLNAVLDDEDAPANSMPLASADSSRFSIQRVVRIQHHDEVFKATLMKAHGSQQFLVVETVAGRCFQSDPESVAVDSWSEVAITSIPGFSDPEEDSDSLVERWTICPDRGLSLMTLTSCSGVRAAFEKARNHGRVGIYHIGGPTHLPDIKDLIMGCEALPEVTFAPVLKVDTYHRFGARCLLVQDVLSPSLCDFLRNVVDSSGERTQQTFQGLSLHDDFWISERVKAESKDLAELLFNRMLPAVKDLV